MSMMFGGWAREKEEEESSPYWDGHNIGYSNGRQSGFNDGISRCQIAVSQSLNLDHEQKKKLWDELENLRWK